MLVGVCEAGLSDRCPPPHPPPIGRATAAAAAAIEDEEDEGEDKVPFHGPCSG